MHSGHHRHHGGHHGGHHLGALAFLALLPGYRFFLMLALVVVLCGGT